MLEPFDPQILSVSTIIWTILVFAGFGFSVCLHEFGHAIVAYWGGDRSVKEKGYLTLNPLRYADATTSLILPTIFLLMGGIPLPGAAVYINKTALKGPVWKSAVSAAGPAATALVAVEIGWLLMALSWLNRFYPIAQDGLLFQGLALLLTLEVAGVFLNLIPIPGLDGYGIIEPWLPHPWQRQLRRSAKYGVWILFAAFWFVPSFSQVFWAIVQLIVQQFGVSPVMMALGFTRFRQGAQILFVLFILAWIVYSQWRKRQPQSASERQTADFTAQLTALDRQLQHHRDAATLVRKSWVLTNLERYEQAIICVEEALNLRADEHQDWLLKGYIHCRLKQVPEAIVAYRTALKLHPQGAEDWTMLGRLHAELGQYDDAISAFEQAIQQAPDAEARITILQLKSYACFNQQQYGDCLMLLEKVLVIHPHDATANYNKACCYAQLGQAEAGIAALAIALANDTELRQQAQTDRDLEMLRSHPNFSALIS